MIPFTESLRHLYPLTRDSWVLDIGAYKGQTAHILAEKYNCRVVCYEPVKEFFDALVAMIAERRMQSHITALNLGVGASERDETFGVKGDMSGIKCNDERRETVHLVAIDKVVTVWAEMLGREADLLAINAEGSEYEILDALLDQGLEGRFKFIQVQPHAVVPRAAQRWAGIRNRLLMNFRVTAEDPQMDIGWLLLEHK